ncbi:NADPH:quinone oxidoreductase family protein [Mycolicibacterium sp.]|uniref:NADPH:quinone oxidoreductase family protein n=1 Tax=Mycolicibacterium sp. TaxID=2320850 RepID=UPI003D11329A
MPRAWRVIRHGEPSEVLRLDHVDPPTLARGQVEVAVLAASCNFADVLLCRGQYQQHPDPPFTPGLEVCGRVTRVGPGVSAALSGARVVGQPVLPHGGFADVAVLEANHCHSVPADVTDTTAAVTHLTHLTAWLGLHRRAAVQPGETVVVTAAAGGVGSAAIQVARAAGATVIAITSGAGKAAAATRFGAHHVVDRSGDVVGEIRRLAPRGADVVLESVGGQSFQQATKYIGFEGRIVVVGFAGGEIPHAALNHAMVKNYTIAGLHWSLYRDHHPDLMRSGQNAIFDLLAAGHLTPDISELSFHELPTSLEQLAAGQIRGKSVITIEKDRDTP